jgi:hypothetical protein
VLRLHRLQQCRREHWRCLHRRCHANSDEYTAAWDVDSNADGNSDTHENDRWSDLHANADTRRWDTAGKPHTYTDTDAYGHQRHRAEVDAGNQPVGDDYPS